MDIQFDDNQLHETFAPLTLTRPVAELRFGIMTIAETWKHFIKIQHSAYTIGYKTESYLSEKFKTVNAGDKLIIMGNVKPNAEIANAVLKLKIGEALYVNSILVAYRARIEHKIELSLDSFCYIDKIWDLFEKNKEALSIDFELLSKNKKSSPISTSNRISGHHNIFIEPGAKVEHAILNGETGPIYIGKNAEIMEGSMIRGPFALCESAVVKMGAKIYGATTIGPFCKVGGEISNTVFQAYSNKGHDGFLGNSIIGEWCNFGADTNSSNLKNNYSKVKIYSFKTEKLEDTPVTFCGVLMGDHSKTGINTMLNTATVVGVSANIFGGGFPEKFIPSYTWGGVDRKEKFDLSKAFEVAKNMMSRRNIELSQEDKSILTYLHKALA